MYKKEEILKFAKLIAQEAGDIISKDFFSHSFKSKLKKDNSAVTEVDLKVEKFLSKKISKKFPEHEILGEEFGEKNVKTEKKGKWYLDPIDGTNNFARHIPFFTVSIAFECNEFSVGVVYAPITKEIFYAATNNGAYLNGKQIFCKNEKKELKECFFGICHNKNKEVLDIALPFFIEMKRSAHDIKKLGSASLEMCYVACGRLDGFIGFDLGFWDFKGAEVIAKEAGAHVDLFSLKNTRNIPVISTCSPWIKDKFILNLKRKRGRK